ncbi:PucR family transcriptional regulator [Streptacidiphilus carbonis]|uniref:PucR family transcriptional regulator n=1 Tax=Streptacidiphilus carbonis TaxID=105422 RepID=UPI0005A72DEF|nr:helix-turn-helix domain-containing protein [Streptacidiphilus carbonis]
MGQGALPDADGVSLRQLLMSFGEPLAELQYAPDLDALVTGVALLDPEDPPSARPGDLVLALGVRGRSALPVLRAAARDGATAVAVKPAPGTPPEALRAAAEDAGVALLSVHPEARWGRLDALVRAALAAGRPQLSSADAQEGDLFGLAQTTAVLTGGIVSIEDTANRILAYSRSADSDEADDLRRLTILGWQGPEPYLSKLREWGVFQQLRTLDTVVSIDPHPELGLRRRLVVAIRSGERQLGTIWVQEGSAPLAERADQALLGAARVAALHLVRRRSEVSADLRLTRTLLAGLLDGATGPQTLAGHLALDVRRPAAVLGFALPGGPEPSRSETLNVISVHAAARHRSALVAPVGDRVYVLLPELPRGVSPETLRGWAQDIADAARRHTAGPLRGAVGRVVPDLGAVAASRAEADRVMDAMAAGRITADIAALPDVRAQVLLGELLELLAANPEVRDPRLTALVAHDDRHGGRLAASVLAWLDGLGDVREAAAGLHIHPNTLRYRVRRAQQLTGLDLSSPEQRLLAMLQLRLPPVEK